jgi:hypothetical protein
LEFNILADKIFDTVKNASSPDRIHGISLAAFLQILEMENKTCTLTVKSRGNEGHLYFVKGELIQADTGKVKGEEAALDIVTWDNVAMEIQYTCNVKKKNIELPLAEILVEGFRIKDDKESTKRKEETMDIKKLNGIIKNLTEDLGDALLTTDIWANIDGQILVGYNSLPEAAALLNQVYHQIVDTLKEADFPPLDKFVSFNLQGDKMTFCLLFEDYQWGMLFDTTRIQLGLLFNVITPKCIEGFNEALSK